MIADLDEVITKLVPDVLEVKSHSVHVLTRNFDDLLQRKLDGVELVLQLFLGHAAEALDECFNRVQRQLVALIEDGLNLSEVYLLGDESRVLLLDQLLLSEVLLRDV